MFPLLRNLMLQEAQADRALEDYVFPEMKSAEWEETRAAYKIPSGFGIVCIIEFDEDAGELTRLFAERLSAKRFCLSDSLGNRGCFFLAGSIKREEVNGLLASILKTMPETNCVFGIGENKPGRLIGSSYIEAARSLRLTRKRSERRLRDRLRIKELRRRIGVASPDEMRRLFRLLCNDIFLDSVFTLAKMRFLVIFTLLWDDITGFWGGGKAEESRNYIDETGNADIRETFGWELMKIRTIAEWEQWSEKNFNLLLEAASDKRSGNLPPPLLKALDYIQEHYKEDLSRSRVAGAAFVSPAYLSRLFSEKLNTTFNYYLTDLRIEKADRLLRETTLSVKEISFTVGFQDPDYFSKVFKKIKGLSVNDTRKK